MLLFCILYRYIPSITHEIRVEFGAEFNGKNYLGCNFKKHHSYCCGWLNNHVKEAADQKALLIKMLPIVKILHHEKIQIARRLPAPLATNFAFAIISNHPKNSNNRKINNDI